MNIIEITSLNK